ncbi:phosphatase PAP2 family protein [Mesorhizobium sp. CAU 1741]|uniref:phosphatase PAP2 family protein n=1 Tax=Mesorhizobium sp. CAU 1741 TaxID=3140366 RepID=UPI00325BC659
MFEWMGSAFDVPMMMVFNQMAQVSVVLDLIIVKFMMLDTVRILPIVTALIAVALMQKHLRDINQTFVTALGGSFVAIFAARIAQNISERPRPIFADIEGFRIPFGTELDIPADWSSFPSDTAALAFALATAVLLRSRLLGSACLVWALVVSTFPRVYAGYHYPSDILGGAIIGASSVMAVAYLSPSWLVSLSESVMRRSQPIYYAAIFVALYTTATMFFDVRQTLSAAADILLEDENTRTTAWGESLERERIVAEGSSHSMELRPSKSPIIMVD